MPLKPPATDACAAAAAQPEAPAPTVAMPDAAALQAALTAWRAGGAQRVDPLRFCYLESLCARAVAASPAVQHIVLRRLHEAVAAYRLRVATPSVVPGDSPPTGPVRPFASVFARRRAAAQGARPTLTVPDGCGEPVESPLAALNRYIRQVGKPGSAHPLVAVDAVGTHPAPAPPASAPGAVGAPVAVDTGRAPGVTATSGPPGAAAVGAPGPGLQLNSARRFGESWSKLQSAQRVEQALQRAPEHAGPFNPHSLMAQSLALMRDVSPAYLHRFVQQADALLWLEQALASHPPVSGAVKPAKPVRSRK